MAVKALGRIRTEKQLYETGDIIEGLPKVEEERLVEFGVAEVVETQEKPRKRRGTAKDEE